MSLQSSPVTNQLIDSLPVRARHRLLSECIVVEWTYGELVCDAGQKYDHVYFPVSGFVSMLTAVDKHQPLEMGLIGNEGILGVTLMLGVQTAPLQSIVQGSGTALAIPAGVFLSAVVKMAGVSELLLRYIHVSMLQLAQAGACLHFHDVEPRLARWLLMTHDRSTGDRFYLTHAFLAQMLGVRRSSVSQAAESLQRQGLISYSRGNINVLDRKGLEAMSCSCHETMTQSRTRIMGWDRI